MENTDHKTNAWRYNRRTFFFILNRTCIERRMYIATFKSTYNRKFASINLLQVVVDSLQAHRHRVACTTMTAKQPLYKYTTHITISIFDYILLLKAFKKYLGARRISICFELKQNNLIV